jgi:hypothetical protein
MCLDQLGEDRSYVLKSWKNITSKDGLLQAILKLFQKLALVE